MEERCLVTCWWLPCLGTGQILLLLSNPLLQFSKSWNPAILQWFGWEGTLEPIRCHPAVAGWHWMSFESLPTQALQDSRTAAGSLCSSCRAVMEAGAGRCLQPIRAGSLCPGSSPGSSAGFSCSVSVAEAVLCSCGVPGAPSTTQQQGRGCRSSTDPLLFCLFKRTNTAVHAFLWLSVPSAECSEFPSRACTF